MEIQKESIRRPLNANKEYTILYVDDEEANLRVFSHSFKREYNVYTALDGPAALKIVETQKIDLVITDQQMPIMSGVDLLARIAEIDPSIARMIITGFSDIGAIIRAVNEFGLDKYLKKPWNKQLLKKEFDHVLKNRTQNGNSKNGNSSRALDTVILQNEEELVKYFENGIILFDANGSNQNSYWFGQNKDSIVAAVFNGSDYQDTHSLNHFFHLVLFQSIYKEGLNSLAAITEHIRHKLDLIINQNGGITAGDSSMLEISIILVNKSRNEIEVLGMNQNVYFYDDEGYFHKIPGQTINSFENVNVSTLPITKVSEFYLLSSNMQIEIDKFSVGVAEITYLETLLNSIHNMPFDAQSKLITRKLKDFNKKCMLAVKF